MDGPVIFFPNPIHAKKVPTEVEILICNAESISQES